MYIPIPIWDRDRQSTIDSIKSRISEVSGIVIIAPYEASIVQITQDHWHQLLNLSFNSKVPIYVIISGHEKNPNLITPDIRLKYVKVIRWPLYWLSETLVRMGWHTNTIFNKSIGNDFKVIENSVFEYLFICMNKRPKLHRFIVMDMLAKYDLIDKNAITYREQYLQDNYELQHWTQKQILLDQTDDSQLFIQERLPEQYSKSCLQLVTETEDDIFFLTEKTAVPLLFGKPFIVATNKDYHKMLTEFGFELYTEIFDYDFDSVEDTGKRMDKLVYNFVQYKNMPAEKLAHIYDKVKDKVIYNRNLAISYACDLDKFPDIWNTVALQGNTKFMNFLNTPYEMNNRLTVLSKLITYNKV